jgi:hypothetical protein
MSRIDGFNARQESADLQRKFPNLFIIGQTLVAELKIGGKVG